MLHIKIICVGKLKEKFYIDAASEYIKRLSSYCKLEIIEIAEEKLPENAGETLISRAMDIEYKKIMEKIPKGYIIATLCIEGQLYSSEEFSDIINDKTCFIIGGSNGLSTDIKKLAKYKISFSKMTFPHHFARVMLLEQVYRGFTIKNGGKYHK